MSLDDGGGGSIIEEDDDDDWNDVGHNANITRVGRIMGLITPSSSDVTPYTTAAEWAAVLAVHDFNNRSFPYPNVYVPENCNFQLSLDLYPFESLMDMAHLYQDMVLLPQNSTDEERPVAVLGTLTSPGSSLLATLGAVAPDWTESNKGILNISPLATSIELEDREIYPYFARTIPSNEGDAAALCRYLRYIEVRRLAVLYWQDSYGQFYYLALTQIASSYGIELFSYSFDADSVTFEQAVREVKKTPLRYVLCIMRVGGWEPLLEALNLEGMLGGRGSNSSTDHGMSSQDEEGYVWFFSDSLAVDLGVYDESYVNDISRFAGLINRTALVSIIPSRESQELQRKQFAVASISSSFLERLNYSTKASDPFNSTLPLKTPEPSLFSLLTYDAILAIGQAGCKIERLAFSSADLHSHLNGLNFTGASGEVELNEDTASRRAQTMTYVIQNILFTSEGRLNLVPSVEVRLNSSEHEITIAKPLIFPSGLTAPPSDVSPPKIVLAETIPQSVQAIVIIIVAFSWLFSIACAAWTIRMRNHRSIRESQPVFLVLLCCGTLLVALSSIFTTWEFPKSQTMLNFGCAASTWFLSIGFTTIFAALYCKTLRIHVVYRNAIRFRRVTVKVKDVLWPILTLLTLNLALLSTWTAIHPPEFQPVIVEQDSFERVTSVRYTCYSDNSTASLICLILLVAVDISALLLLNIESYRSRHLPSKFNESFYIAITNLVLLEAVIIGIPILLIVKSQRTAYALVRALLTLVFCLAVLIPTFVPKFTNWKCARDRRFLMSVAGTGAPNHSSPRSVVHATESSRLISSPGKVTSKAPEESHTTPGDHQKNAAETAS